MKRHYLKLTILIIVFPLPSLLIPRNVHCASDKNPITVVFLYDDVSSLSSTDIEAKVIDTFRNCNICCTFGVIPHVCLGEWRDIQPQDVAPLPPSKVKIMKTAINNGTLEVVLHGYSHQAISKDGYCGYTEFCGLTYNGQEKKIGKGKNYLEKQLNMPVPTFYPTWNSYDSNTIRAIENLSLKTLFGMEYGYAKEDSTLNFLPFTCDLRYLGDALKSARRIADDQSVVVTLVRSSDLLGINMETGRLRFDQFVELIDEIISQRDIQVRTIDQAIKAIDDLSAHRFLTYNSYLKLSHYLYPLMPPRLVKKLFPFGVYLSSNTAKKMKIKLLTFTIAFYILIFIISVTITFIGGSILFRSYRSLALICKYCTVPVFFIFLFHSLYRLDFSFHKLLLETTLYGYRHNYYRLSVLLVASFGLCIGIWSSLFKANKRHSSDKLKSG